jgi:hypothetical protein
LVHVHPDAESSSAGQIFFTVLRATCSRACGTVPPRAACRCAFRTVVSATR